MTQFFDKRTKWEKIEDFMTRFIGRCALIMGMVVVLAIMGLTGAFIYLVVRGMMI